MSSLRTSIEDANRMVSSALRHLDGKRWDAARAELRAAVEQLAAIDRKAQQLEGRRKAVEGEDG